MNFLDRCSRKAKISNFIKIGPVETELFHADGQKDGRTDMMKLIDAFRNFANALKKRLYLLVSNQLILIEKNIWYFSSKVI